MVINISSVFISMVQYKLCLNKSHVSLPDGYVALTVLASTKCSENAEK